MSDILGGIGEITVCTVVQNCCKGDEPCQWNTPIFRPRGSNTPKPIDIKFDRGDYVGDITPQAHFGISIPKGAVVHMREIVIVRVYFFTPPLLLDFLRTCRGRTV